MTWCSGGGEAKDEKRETDIASAAGVYIYEYIRIIIYYRVVARDGVSRGGGVVAWRKPDIYAHGIRRRARRPGRTLSAKQFELPLRIMSVMGLGK